MAVESRNDTCFLRFVAILLITNSHLKSLYPIPYLATGGAIGNAIFFALSGYGLVLSWERVQRPLSQWYWRRILRIYPSVLLCVAIFHFGLAKSWTHWNPMDYIWHFVWPTPFWFVAALMVFYLIFFSIMTLDNRWALAAGIFLVILLYLYFYLTHIDLSKYSIEGPGYFKWLFYLQVMFFGGLLAHNKVNKLPSVSISIFLLVIFIIFYYSAGLLFIQGRFAQYQIVIHLLTYPIVFLCFGISKSHLVIKKIMGNKILNYVISLIAGVTLEIYLLQYFVYGNGYIRSLSFPINIFSFVFILLLASVVLAKAADLVRSSFKKLSFGRISA